jgi:hypothetical protein
MEPMGIKRHRWASREVEMSGSERVNTTLSGSGRVDDIRGHPQGELRGQAKTVKITEDDRKYAAEHAIDENAAIEHGMKEKAAEFQHSGAQIYSKTS